MNPEAAMAFLQTAVLTLAALLSYTARTWPDQYREGSPEATIVAFFRAMYANDVAAFDQLTMPDPERSRLTAGGKRNDDRLRALSDDPGSLQIKIKRPFQLKGKAVTPDARDQYPIGTTARYSVAHQGSPMVVSLVKQADGWKIDPRWWIAMTHLTGEEPPRASPEYAIKNLLLAMLALNKTAASGFLAPGGKVDVLWTEAPRYREPSGVLEASVVEMPLVEIKPGEFVELPSRRVVEGVAAADRKVLIGLFGPTEMGFVVQKVGTEWRVEAEPYFVLLNR
jgi:hypothetical protein